MRFFQLTNQKFKLYYPRFLPLSVLVAFCTDLELELLALVCEFPLDELRFPEEVLLCGVLDIRLF